MFCAKSFALARCFAYSTHHFIPCTTSSVLAEVSPELPEPPTALRSQEERLRYPDWAGFHGRPCPHLMVLSRS
jgi:hypothetical protein